jgi:hypothetical protein
MPPLVCVFSSAGLKRLRQRIDELKDEKEQLRKNQKQLRKEHVLVVSHACLLLHFRRHPHPYTTPPFLHTLSL